MTYQQIIFMIIRIWHSQSKTGQVLLSVSLTLDQIHRWTDNTDNTEEKHLLSLDR